MVTELKAFDTEVTQSLSTRNLKICLYSTFKLTNYEIENLVAYLDKDRNGYVTIAEIEAAVKMA